MAARRQPRKASTPSGVERTLGRLEAGLDEALRGLQVHEASQRRSYEATQAALAEMREARRADHAETRAAIQELRHELGKIDVPGTVRRLAVRWAAGVGALVAMVAQVYASWKG